MDLGQGAADGDSAHEAFAAMDVTDGLPVVLPTPARVEQMLKLHGFDPREVVTVLPPLFSKATWQDIAINAVMAGCRPEYLPVVGAAIEAIAGDEFNLMDIGTTTGSAAPLIIVNGPIVKKLGINAAGNALGPGNRANATIGRAVSLTLRNVGGARPGEVDMSTLGQPAKYTCCLAENESASPWLPLHVERGFSPMASVVTVVGATGTLEVVDSISRTGADLAQTFAQSMLIAGTAGSGKLTLGSGEPLIILPPESAMIFERDGYTKEKTKTAIYERAVMPLDRFSAAMRERLMANAATAEAASDPHAAFRIARRAADIMIVVAGGVGIKAAYVPTWGETKAVSRQIRNSD